MSDKKCALCNNKCYKFYALCKDCLELNKKGLIKKNDVTGKWEYINKKEPPKKIKEEKIIKEQETTKITHKPKCLTCGKETNGLFFCLECFHKYKNKELLLRIRNCTNFEILDEDYEGKFTCKDGHIVKSKAEREIDNYLFDHEIKHIYEKELSYGAEKDQILHPDFCLPDYLGKNKDVYIEHWGYNENNIHYTKTKKFKMPIYKELCSKKTITLICTYEKTDTNKIYDILDRKLNKNFIKENEINFEEK